MTLPIPPTNGKGDLIIRAVRDLGFPIVISGILLYSVLWQIPRNEVAINNGRAEILNQTTAIKSLETKVDQRCPIHP